MLCKAFLKATLHNYLTKPCRPYSHKIHVLTFTSYELKPATTKNEENKEIKK